MVTTARAAGIAATGIQGVSINNSAPSMSTPTQVAGAVSKSLGYTPNAVSTNPHDAPGYNPATDPTSSAYNPSAVTTPTTAKPVAATPTTPPAQTPTATQPVTTPATQSTPSGISGDAPLTGSTADQAGQAIDQLKAKYGKALTDITGAGVDSPASQGSANAGINAALKTQPDPQKPTPIPQSVQTFSDPSQNPLVDDQMAQLREFLSPASDRQQLNDSIAQLSADRSALSGLKTELLNVKNVMSGSADDIRKEIEASGGFGTNSQVMALAAARNIPLLKKSQDLSDQIQSQTDLVNSDISLVGDEKQMAATQFSENMSMLNFQQQNNKDLANAFQTNVELIQKTAGWAGVLQAYGSNPNQLAYVDSLYGGPGSIAKLAAVPDVQSVKDSLEIQGLKLDNAKKSQDLNASTPGTQAYSTAQDKLEQQYRTVLLKEASNRSGDLGIQNSKVSQAVHLTALLNQYKDPKTGNYNVPAAQYSELAMGLANLISPSGSAESDRQAIMSKTAAGDLKGALSYITGTPQNGNTQQIIKNLADSIDRQGATAEDLRDEQVNFLQGLAPTGLDQSRIDALNKQALPSYKSYKQTGSLTGNPTDAPKLLAPAEIPSGYYQASDGLLYKK